MGHRHADWHGRGKDGPGLAALTSLLTLGIASTTWALGPTVPATRPASSWISGSPAGLASRCGDSDGLGDEVVLRARDDAVPPTVLEGDAARPGRPQDQPVADAGDDQLALVGRQVTLNGARSQPRGELGYRWVQVGGPRVRLRLEDGYVLSFVPDDPGTYRFALVVARGSRISEPDVVEVLASAAVPGPRLTGMASSNEPWPLDAQVRGAIQRAPDGPAVAVALAATFDHVADRMDLYTSYSEAHAEMARQLEAVVPADPARRKAWVDALFQPLTDRLIEAMFVEGLDLRRTEGQRAPLTPAQKARLVALFRSMAEGARAARVWQ